MKKPHVVTLPLAALLAAAAPNLASAGPEAGDRTFSLSGTGSSDEEFDRSVIGVSGELGWFVTDRVEAGLRQNVGVVAIDDGDDAWSGGTRGFVDLHFGAGAFQPYLGVNLGGLYGENVNDTFAAGPEAGAKFYVKDKTFIEAQAEYQFLFDDADEIDDRFDDGAWVYTLGVGYHF